MEVRSGRAPAGADAADDLPARDPAAAAHAEAGEMCVAGPHAAAVVDDQQVAEPDGSQPAKTTRPAAAARTRQPDGAGKSRPAWKRSPRGPNRSPARNPRVGRDSANGTRGTAARASARKVAGPATPSAGSPTQRWKRITAATVCQP